MSPIFGAEALIDTVDELGPSEYSQSQYFLKLQSSQMQHEDTMDMHQESLQSKLDIDNSNNQIEI